jgi:type IV secretory pathway VirB2 component (pilin)
VIEPSAAADCERILQSWWGQPVNTITAIAFVVAGGLVWWRRRDPTTSSLVVAVGVGSVAFHGPMPPWGEFLHDVSIALTLVWVLLVELKREHLRPLGLALGLGGSVTPVVADPAQAVAAVAVIGLILISGDRRAIRWTAVAILAVGALVGTLSQTGWPLCHPDSLWQGHGFWHLSAAAALAIWGVAIRPDRPAIPAGSILPRTSS